MKKLLWLLLLLLMTATVQAAPIQQNTAPSIETFTASLRAVDRSALQNRRVRIPVSWSTVNRPLTSNLYFEQVFADGSSINVELPRLFPWVSSSGDGVVAPIMPFNAAAEITLRLRLVDFFSQEVYSERQITLPIANTGDPGADFGFVPTLTRFSIQSPTILRSQLNSGAARIGVSWQAINRPLTATLVFEQIMPDGSVINVELPRSTPWVNSAGDGVVAPRDPGSVDQVRLRVRLLDLLNGRIYDQRYAIVNILTPQPASIQSFNAAVSSVDAQRLAQRVERVPVSWSVSNRPQNSNLVFEQILSDGRLVNVELPRQNPIVPSSGSGVVAPLLPGGNATQIQLSLRLIDLGTGSEYARRNITVPIVSTIPNEGLIATFNSTATSVNIGSLLGGTTRVPVSWSLRARPANTNLIFEQRLLNGQTVNVELPRQNPIVPSSGSGTTAPVWPGDQAQEIVLLLRVVNLSSGATLDSAEIHLPIVGNTGGGIDYGATCLQSPYAPTQGLAVGVNAQVISGDTANGLRALNLPQGDFVETLPVGETFTIIGGPACWTIQTFAPAQTDFRVWRIRTFRNNLEAWLPEYQYIVDGARYVYYLQPVQTDGGGDQDPVINSFTAGSSSAAPGGTVVLNWTVAHASSVSIQVLDPAGQAVQNFDNLPLQSGLNYTLPQDTSGPLRFVLSVRDAQGGQLLSQELSVSISCAFANPMDPNRCPASQATVQMAYQTYQNGIMLWRGDSKLIYVLYNDGSFQSFDDTWTPDQPADSGETPPDGLILPAHGFGKVWANQPGVRDRIGWATTPESGFSGTIESYTGPTETFISMPDGRTLVIGQGWRTQ